MLGEIFLIVNAWLLDVYIAINEMIVGKNP